MKPITLVNTLTKDERIQLNRLFGHDGLKPFVQTNGAICPSIKNKDAKILEERRVLDKMYFLAKVIETVKDFNLNETIKLHSNVSDTHHTTYSLEKSVNRLKSLFEIDFLYNICGNIPKKILTKTGPLQCVLFNLIKNGFEHTTDNSSVFLNINYINSFPLNVVHTPEGAKNHNEFLGFHISNKGYSFSPEKKPEDYIIVQPRKDERGFGLYFTGLVARVLQAPINIESNDDITTVSFFQPIYKQE